MARAIQGLPKGLKPENANRSSIAIAIAIAIAIDGAHCGSSHGRDSQYIFERD